MTNPTRINRRRLFIPIAITLVILAAYNILIHFAAKKTQRQHLLATIDKLPPSTECLFLGNSLIEAGCDAGAFQHRLASNQCFTRGHQSRPGRNHTRRTLSRFSSTP